MSKEAVERIKHSSNLRKSTPPRHKNMPEVIPRQSFARRKEELPDCMGNFEQEAAVIKNVTNFQPHSMFMFKKADTYAMEKEFQDAPPMPQVAEWMKLLEATPTRMPICDFVILRPPSQ